MAIPEGGRERGLPLALLGQRAYRERPTVSFRRSVGRSYIAAPGITRRPGLGRSGLDISWNHHGAPESAFTALHLNHRESNPALTGDGTRD